MEVISYKFHTLIGNLKVASGLGNHSQGFKSKVLLKIVDFLLVFYQRYWNDVDITLLKVRNEKQILPQLKTIIHSEMAVSIHVCP